MLNISKNATKNRRKIRPGGIRNLDIEKKSPGPSEVKVYYLSPEELEYYRNLKPPGCTMDAGARIISSMNQRKGLT